MRAQDASDQCVFTQGYWKNHPEAWPVSSLTLGDRTYTQAELLAILDEPVVGNGLVALAHQLITAKLNVALGAPDSSIADDIAAADALIDGLVVPPIGEGYLAPATTSELNDSLDAFNNSELSGEACEEQPACGDGTVDEGEQCDDGNTTSGDGCSATCETEPPPPPPPSCGDGNVDAGEQC
ncbi:MAG TPA: myxococcus cysteine-rich repeat containing protein, partial [Kofleriaceae bacterium]